MSFVDIVPLFIYVTMGEVPIYIYIFYFFLTLTGTQLCVSMGGDPITVHDDAFAGSPPNVGGDDVAFMSLYPFFQLKMIPNFCHQVHCSIS